MVENNDRSSSRVGLCDSAKAGLARVCERCGEPRCKSCIMAYCASMNSCPYCFGDCRCKVARTCLATIGSRRMPVIASSSRAA